ncbi:MULTISPECIES: CPBP family intramembrane glutamic endopeptidase [Bacillus cereus group]|uniref:CPBP family intramembrane metalloprotease n=2 Tax=Bacillus cereus group TaxID=86661 RepID=A0A243AL77_BACTU|nr:type II CAAX endopeptidase family protein [Bacillus thuringiensis]OTY23611.1 CPBP family intramembrane metalloprotease [Bacillus thuringiensis serovar navarrensis]
MQKQRNTMQVYFIAYLFLFYFIWTLKELWLVKYIGMFSTYYVPLETAFLKILIWVIPVWLFIKYKHHEKPVKYLKLDSNIFRGWVWGISLSLLLGLRFVIEVYVVKNTNFNFNLHLNDYLNTVIIAGFAEEIVFRGFILKEFNKRFSFWKANSITTFLFLFVHYPAWFYTGELSHIWNHIYIFLIGLFFGYVFKETKSLWAVIFLHLFHNLFVIIS